ncbi:MAG: translational GTPase TypA [Clostridiales bacterium]|nr:translational GTPase TypA [Clostridiales bacterium]
MLTKRDDIRNIAIIAHVDHGKTTLVDELLKQSGTFRSNQIIRERVMDSGDLERERGITILSKNTSVYYDDIKINIVDTPGHADFGGEVERVLKMVNGVVLVVDAFEGAMPQTKFVLKNALSLGLPVVVCINKIDRPEARPDEVVDEVLELFIELDANDDQLESPFVFASAKEGKAGMTFEEAMAATDMKALFDVIEKHIPAPEGDIEAPLQILVTTIDYNEYVGKIGIGKVENGVIRVGDEVAIVNHHDPDKLEKIKVTKLYEFEGLERIEINEASVGAICAVSGMPEIHIGDTITSVKEPMPMEYNKISEPTISMTFSVNDSPFAGREGKFVTSRHLRDRLFKELNTDVSLRVEETDEAESYKVSGRGELHLSILIETMRREGYEFQVSRPEVLYKTENGKKLEPMEIVTIDVPEEYVGAVIEKLGTRHGEMTNMAPSQDGYTRIEFNIPSRGLIGYRNEFLTDTRGTGIMNSLFNGYEPYKGDIFSRTQGSLIAFEAGESITYGLFNAQERGELFIGPGVKVYSGMVVGKNSRQGDIEVNVCKRKQLTNTRAAGSDEALKLVPHLNMSLEQAIDFIAEDELVEVTPENLRIRKKLLDPVARRKAHRK